MDRGTYFACEHIRDIFAFSTLTFMKREHLNIVLLTFQNVPDTQNEIFICSVDHSPTPKKNKKWSGDYLVLHFFAQIAPRSVPLNASIINF